MNVLSHPSYKSKSRGKGRALFSYFCCRGCEHVTNVLSVPSPPYRGVAHQEYNDVLRDHGTIIPEGNRLFQHAGHWADKWQMQQDNAGPHKTAANMACIADSVPGGHFLAWPANSPDLSPIENLWGWMNSKLHKLDKCKNIEELKEKLEQVRQSIPANFLHNMFDGMKARMQRVIDLNGDYIGK